MRVKKSERTDDVASRATAAPNRASATALVRSPTASAPVVPYDGWDIGASAPAALSPPALPTAGAPLPKPDANDPLMSDVVSVAPTAPKGREPLAVVESTPSAAEATDAREAEPKPVASTPAPVGAASTGAAPSSAARRAQLDALTNSRLTMGNSVELLFDGASSFAARNALIDEARESICLQTFIFDSDDTGWALARQLATKAREGVKVRVIYDAAGSLRANSEMFDFMRAAGVELKAYGELWKVWEANDRSHEKHLIVDGKTSIEGGMNIANEYALGGTGQRVYSRGDEQGVEAWRDVDVKLVGPAVSDAMTAFLGTWERLSGPLTAAEKSKLLPPQVMLETGVPVRVVESNPNQVALKGNAMKLYAEAIDSATQSIRIETAYFLPPKHVRDALIRAAKRGVDVQVLTNGHGSSDAGYVADAARYFYDGLIDAGVKIYEKLGGTLHSKTAAFDHQYSIVGSANLNGRSENLDTEVAVAIESEDTATKLEQRFADGLSAAALITKKDLDSESFATNLKQWAVSRLAWTF